MSGTNKNFVLAYAFLVILPLIGLAGILKSGRSVLAPVSIDGVWNLHVNSGQLDFQPCGPLIAAIPEKAFTISQSGKTFALSFPGLTNEPASGTLEGNTLRASIMVAKPGSNGCEQGKQLALLANVDQSTNASLLTGTFSSTECPSCAPVSFRAERQPVPADRGGR